jgi:catalase
MRNKFILQQFQNGELIKEVEIKSLRDIEKLLSIEYHQVRQLFLHCTKNTKAHPFIKNLANDFKIIENKFIKPNILI